jgi:hypothetical protein
MKKRVIIGAMALTLTLAGAACAAEADEGTKADAKAPTATEAPAKKETTTTEAPKVSKGLGSKDATADVGKPVLDPPDIIGSVYVHVPVTNHSSKRSDYFIDITAESADGKTQIDTTTAFVQNVEPGQSADAKTLFLNDIPAGTQVRITGVQRTASL